MHALNLPGKSVAYLEYIRPRSPAPMTTALMGAIVTSTCQFSPLQDITLANNKLRTHCTTPQHLPQLHTEQTAIKQQQTEL